MKKRVISLVLCLLMVLSLIPTTAFASDIATQDKERKVSHIDIQMALNIPGVNNVQLDDNDMTKLNISAKQGGADVSYTWNNYKLKGSTDGQGNQQVRLNGSFPIGTQGNPVEYTITLTKTVSGVPYTLTLTASYWKGNVCPGLTTGGDPGIDVKFGEGQSSGYQVTITKKIEGIDSKDLAANQKFKFAIKDEKGAIVKELEAVTNQGVDTANATTFLKAGTYTVEETSYATYEGYEFKETKYSTENGTLTVNENGGSITVTNTYAPTAPATTSVTVTKAWAGQNGIPEAKLPTSVTVKLLQNGNDIDRTLTLTKDGNWTGTFSGLRVKDDDGVNYVYTVVDSVPGYTTTPGNADNNYTVTNTANWITPEVKSLPDLKIAKVDGDNKVITTGEATFELKKDGESTGKTIITSNGYGTFADLEEGTYTLTETVAPGGYVKSNTVWTIKVEEVSRTVEEVMANGVVTGYRTRITYGVTVTADGTTAIGPMDGAYPFTNTAISKFDIPVKKVWTGDEYFTALRPESITVRLYKVVNDESVPTGMSLTLSAANNWNGSFTGLDATDSDGNSIAYTVEEDTVPGYTSLLSGDKDGFTINNTLDTGSLKITKVLDGITASENMTFTVKIEGTVNGKAITKNVPITVEQGKTSGTVDVTLPSGDYTVTEIEPITKTVGYYEWTGVSYAYQNISVNRVNSAEADTVAKVGAAKHPVVIVTNTYEETYTDITVTKQWANVKDSDNVAQYEIKVELYANGQPTGKILTLTKAGNWTGKFEKLDIKDKDGKVITYTVVETNVPKDFTSIDGTKENNYTVTNIHDYEIEIPFTKVVKKAPGSNNPGKATFTFVAYYMDANNAPVNVGTATVETNGEGTYSGKIKVKLSAGLPDDSIELMLAEVKGAPGSWTYADTVYNVHITGVSTDKPTVTISLANKLVEKAIFTNTYSYTYTPPRPRPNPKPVPSAKTGDMGIALYALTSLLSLSGTALVIKKRKDEE